jgi:hypothetical protein
LDKEKERYIIANLIVQKMRRCTEIFGILDHYKEHGTIGYPKKLAVLDIDDQDLKQLLFIQKNYPTYKARKLRKAEAETDKDKRKQLMQEYKILCTQLDEARAKIKALE